MKNSNRLFFAAVLAMACVFSVSAKSLKVLMIGNSFSICVLKEMPACSASAGDTLDLASLYIGGCPLDRHWDNVEKAGDPNFKPYSFSWSYASCADNAAAPIAKLGNKTNIPQALVADKWDIVTIQQASGKSPFPDSYEPFAGQLIAKIRELAPQAEIVIQQTWSYTPYDKRLATWKMTPADMHAALKKAYAQLAGRYGLRIIPTGDAVQMYRARLPVDYGTPLDQAQIAALAEPTLIDFHGDVTGNSRWGKGGKWEKDHEKFRLRIDASHLNPEGNYLQALVWQAALFGTDVTKLAYRPEALSEEKAVLMRRCAMAAVRGGWLEGSLDAPLLVSGQGRVYRLAPDGRITWQQAGCGNLHRAYLRGDGSLLYSNGALMLVERPGQPSAAAKCLYAPAPKESLYGFELLAGDKVLIAENALDRLSCFALGPNGAFKEEFRFAADSSENGEPAKSIHHHYRMCRMTPSGTILVCCSGARRVREFDRSGKLLWEQPVTGRLAFDCLRRANGNTLVSHLDAVSEYTPAHELVWQFKCEDAPGLKLANLCGIQELPNGNLVVGTYANGLPDASRATAFETTRDKKIVWSWSSSGDRSMMTCWKLK